MEQYVRIPKSVLLDRSLSLRAKGLYGLILSLPSQWNGSIQYFTEESGMSRHAVCKTIQELESKKYLVRHQMVDENGCFAGMEYELKVREYDDTQ